MSITYKATQYTRRLPPLPTVRDLVKLYRLRAIKQLSQNFLMDERIIDKIVKAAGKLEGAYVCEVGPGPGGITRSIIKRRPKKIIVVEKDARFLPTLELLAEVCRETTDHTEMDIIINDIMSYNLESAFGEVPKHEWTDPPPPIHLIGNLPFSVSTPLIVRWLKSISEQKSAWSYGRTRMTLTFQKEVAERICAPIMSAQRCRLSSICQIWCQVNHVFTIPGKAFVPKPDVDVGVVTFTPLKTPLTNLPFSLVEKVLRHIYNMRQKYAIRGGKTLFPEDRREELGEKLFALADIDPTTRPFQLTNSEFARLCAAYDQICQEQPDIRDYDYRACKKVLERKVEDVEVKLD